MDKSKIKMNKIYVGHTGHNLRIRILEYQRYIRANNPKSGYALHIQQ